MRVWIDQDSCTGAGLCTDHCPELFVVLEDGIGYVRDGQYVGDEPGERPHTVWVPGRLEQTAIDAAVKCPGECIYFEADEAPDDDESDIVDAEIVD